MSDLKFEIDVDSIAQEFENFKERVKEELTKGVESVASMTHAKTLELARDELNSLSQDYMENVEFDNPEENLWVVTLKNPAMWIEEGRKCIVYGKNSSHIPKILTPDGEIPITKAKVGMLVLNQYGKWTEITDIYDEHLVEKSKLEVFEIKACRYMPKNKKLHKREYSLGFKTKCKVCGEQKKYSKLKNKERKNKYCGNCLSKQEVYQVKIGGSLNSNNSNWTTMYLTGDHKVMTQNGWKEIRDFTQNDCVIVPSWSKCKSCKKPTYYGKDFCYDNNGGRCSSSYSVNLTLQKGGHQSQKPDARASYLKKLKILQKTNKTEDQVEFFLKKAGYKVGIYPNNESDFIREYPVKVKSDGKYSKKTYFIDFFCPKLNLGIEVDGKAWHCSKKDSIRDRLIKKTSKIDIVRIPAKNVWKKNFFEETLIPLVKNHSGEIRMLPFKSFRVKLKKMSPFSPINRRWDITVKDGESFICNRILIHNSGFMEELLNGKSAKTSKDGKKYAVIPFKHNKNPERQSQKAQELANQIKDALKERGINWKKIERNEDGSPRVGRLHSFNLENPRAKKEHKNPLTHGISVYQTKTSDGNVRKDVMTFRVITEEHRNEGLWIHPGREGSKILDKAFEWAMSTWERDILPNILKEYE